MSAQIVLLRREDYLLWFIPILVGCAVLGVAAMLVRRRFAAPGMALALCALLVAPGAYAASTWTAPVEGTFPAAGPRAAAGAGGVGVAGRDLSRDESLIRYVDSHLPGTRWPLFTDAAPTAAPFILLGMNAASLAGYSGTDPAVGARELAQMVARHEARYAVLGGEFSSRGGNGATAAILRACKLVAPGLWHGPIVSTSGLVLFDCAGRARALAARPAAAPRRSLGASLRALPSPRRPLARQRGGSLTRRS